MAIPLPDIHEKVASLVKRVAQLEADRPAPVPYYEEHAESLRGAMREAEKTNGNIHNQRTLIKALDSAIDALGGYRSAQTPSEVLAELERRAANLPHRVALRVSDLAIKRDEIEKRLADVERRTKGRFMSAPFPHGYGKLSVSVEGDTMMSDAMRKGVEMLRERDVPSVNSSGADDPAVGSASPRTATSPTIGIRHAAMALGAIADALDVKITARNKRGDPVMHAWPSYAPQPEEQERLGNHEDLAPVLARRICSDIETAIASHEHAQSIGAAPETEVDKAMNDAAIYGTGFLHTAMEGERLVPRHKHTGIVAGEPDEISWEDMEGMLLPLALVAQCSIKAHNGTWSLTLPYDRAATDRDRTIAYHLVSAYRMIAARA